MASKALKSWAFLAAFTALGAPGASATGSFGCTIDDANLALTLLANTSSQHGTIVRVFGSSLTLKSRALAMAGQTFKIEDEHLIQQWFLNRELRVAIGIDDKDGSLLLTIAGQLNRDRERYSGRYQLTVSFPHGSTWTATGPIKSCSGG
jgi:hypothetical protein